MGKDFAEKLLLPVIAVVAAVFAFSSFFIVPPGEVAIKTRLGSIVDSYSEGLHFKMPFLENITKFSIQISAPIFRRRHSQRTCRP